MIILKKKLLAVILLIVFIFPIALFVKPVFAIDQPVLKATVEIRGKDDSKKQIYTVKWEVPGGEYWAQTPKENYVAVYRSKDKNGVFSDWKPVTVGNSARVMEFGKISGFFKHTVTQEDYGKEYQFGIVTNQSLQSDSVVDDASVTAKTELIKNKTKEEVTVTPTPESQNVLTDTGNIFERMIALLVEVPITVIKGIGSLADFREIDELVFLAGAERDNMPWKDADQKDKMLAWFQSFMWATLPLYVFVTAYNGFKLMYSANNPMARAEAMESIQRWFFSLGIIIFAPIFVSLIMTISGITVDAVSYAFGEISGGVTTEIALMDYDITTGSVLGTAFIKTMFALLYLYFNVIYIVRMVAISVMFGFTPLMAIMWAVKKDVTAIAVWMGELASNAFMPVAHGLVICTILLLTNKDSWVHILIMLYCLIPLSEVLRNSMMSVFTRAAGFNEQKVGMGVLGSALGLGGLVSMGRMGGAIFGSKNIGSGGRAISASKGISVPQRMPNLSRKPSSQGSSFAPPTNFNKMNFGKLNGHPMYIQHNWDHKNPKPTALRKPKKATNPKTYSYKQPAADLHMSSALSKAIPMASTVAKSMVAPAMLLAGAVPGGMGMAAGAYMATAGIARGVGTAAMVGKNIASAKKENGGNTAQAVRRVTGVNTTAGAVRSMAGTIGGSIINPSETLAKSLQEKNSMAQRESEALRIRKARLDARLNPIKLKQKPSSSNAGDKQSNSGRNYTFNHQPGRERSNKNTANQTGQSNKTNRPKGARVVREETNTSKRTFTREQLRNSQLRRTFKR